MIEKKRCVEEGGPSVKIVNRVDTQDAPKEKIDWKDVPFTPISNTKFVLRLGDGSQIEAAVFKLMTPRGEEHHACISCQAGCKFGCEFCQSGKNGFARHMTREEIEDEISTLTKAEGLKKLDSILFMGIGEPLDNYDAVVPAIRDLVETKGFENRVSLATIGIPAKMERLAAEKLPLEMVWISVHAPSDDKRSEIMPVNRKYNVRETVAAAAKFAKETGTKTWINYMIFKGFNDSPEDAKALVDLLAPYKDDLKLMTTMPNHDLPKYKAGEEGDLTRFEQYLVDAGISNHWSRFVASGREVDAGCGEFIFVKTNN